MLAALLHMDLKTQEQAVRDIAANLGPAALESMLNSARQANTPAPAPAPADEPRSADNVPLSERLKQPLVLYAMGVSAVAVLLVTLVILKPEERIGEEAAKRWRQLMKYAPIVQRAQKSLPVRVVMACMQLLPVVDIITDVLSLAHYVLSAWYAWAATCAVILFYNWRFSLLFAVLHPKPSARKLGLLYMPGLLLYGWSELTTPDEDEESTIEPSVDESVVQSQRGGGMERSDTRNTRTGDPGGGGVFGSLFGSKRGVAEDAQQPSTGKKPVVLLGRVPTSASARGAAPTAGPNPGFGGRLFGKQGSRSGLTEAAVAKASQKESAAARRARKAQEAVQQMLMDNDKAIASRIFRLLDAEVKKAPKAMGPGRVLAGLKIEAIVSALAVPVGLFIIARASLMLAEAKLFRFRGDRAVEAKRRVLCEPPRRRRARPRAMAPCSDAARAHAHARAPPRDRPRRQQGAHLRRGTLRVAAAARAADVGLPRAARQLARVPRERRHVLPRRAQGNRHVCHRPAQDPAGAWPAQASGRGRGERGRGVEPLRDRGGIGRRGGEEVGADCVEEAGHRVQAGAEEWAKQRRRRRFVRRRFGLLGRLVRSRRVRAARQDEHHGRSNGRAACA